MILRKIIKFVATRCQILRLKCTKFDFGWGSAPDPAGGAYSAPPDPLAGLRGPTSKGMGQGKGGEGKGRDGREGEGKRREGRDGPLILPPTPNLLPPPMAYNPTFSSRQSSKTAPIHWTLQLSTLGFFL